MAGEGFLNRWSRLKHDAAAPASPRTEDAARLDPQAPSGPPARRDGADAGVLREGQAATPAASPEQAVADAGRPGTDARRAAQADDPQRTLPSLNDLGFDSDYSPFMRPEVDPGMRMSALKKLFADPHFNRMDGLDVYIDDYSKPDPMPRAMLARLNQSRLLGLFEGEEEKTAVTAADGAGASPATAEGAATDPAGATQVAAGATGDPQVAGPELQVDAGREPADAAAISTAEAPLDPAADSSSDTPPDSRQAT